MAGFGGNSYSNAGVDIPVAQVDNLTVSVINSYQSSAQSLWDCAMYTWELFDKCGLYERSFTETLCNTLAIHRDTLYHWRKAWDLRQKITGLYPNFDFGKLTISHFYHAADFVPDMGLEWVAEFLETASNENWSTRALDGEMRMSHSDKGTLPWIMTGLEKLLNKLHEIYGSSEYAGLSDDQREKLRRALDLLQDILK